MKYRTLGKTGIKVSELTIGAWQLGGPLSFKGKPDGHPDPGRENVLRMIRELGDLGINSIDTAEQYGNGESERRVGEAIRGLRDRWVVTSKFGYRVGSNDQRIDDSSPPTILPSLEGSLRRLGTDHIDVYLYHCAPSLGDLEQGRRVLEKAKEEGKIRAYGISTANAELTASMLEMDAIEVIQFPTNLLDEQPQLWKLAQENRLGTQLRGVMAQGRLSGKYFRGGPIFRSDDIRLERCTGEDYTRFAALEECLPVGMTMAQAAIRWVLEHAGATTICMGAKNIGDYRGAIEAVSLPNLSPEVCERFKSVAISLNEEKS